MDIVLEKRGVSVQYLLEHPETIKYAYQPIYQVQENRIYGYEALMRPEPFSPDEFIEAAAEMDCLIDIEEITNYYGIYYFMKARLEGKVFINTFPAVCMRLEVADKVAKMGGMEMADRLVYEVVEYTNLESYAWNMKRVAFRSSGASPLVALDDYGTGANIDQQCLDFYQPDIVKIDRKFVDGVDLDPEKQHCVREMYGDLRARHIMILAEGVETEGEYRFFKELGVDLMQGYFLGKPKIYQ